MLRWVAQGFLLGALGLAGCDVVDIDNNGGSIVLDECTGTSAEPLGAADPPGVVATCDDHLPCTWDIQCTPCSQVPEELRIKATCTYDNQIDPFCLDSATGAYLYTGCVHFIADPTPEGQTNACFPVAHSFLPNGHAYSGVCNEWGVCVDNP